MFCLLNALLFSVSFLYSLCSINTPITGSSFFFFFPYLYYCVSFFSHPLLLILTCHFFLVQQLHYEISASHVFIALENNLCVCARMCIHVYVCVFVYGGGGNTVERSLHFRKIILKRLGLEQRTGVK